MIFHDQLNQMVMIFHYIINLVINVVMIITFTGYSIIGGHGMLVLCVYATILWRVVIFTIY